MTNLVNSKTCESQFKTFQKMVIRRHRLRMTTIIFKYWMQSIISRRMLKDKFSLSVFMKFDGTLHVNWQYITLVKAGRCYTKKTTCKRTLILKDCRSSIFGLKRYCNSCQFTQFTRSVYRLLHYGIENFKEIITILNKVSK